MRRFVMIIALASAALLPRATWAAADAEENPETLIRVGNDLRRKGDDKRAEGYLRRAYGLAHTPRAAAELGLVELALGRFLDAESLLTEALSSEDPWVRDLATTLTDTRDRVRRSLFDVEIVGAPKDATILAADGTVTKLRADGSVWLRPGSSSFEVEAIGHRRAHVAIAGTAGQKQVVVVSMPALVATTAPTPSEPTKTGLDAAPARAVVDDDSAHVNEPNAASTGRSMRVSGLVVGAAGVVVGVVGLVLLSEGNTKVDAINKQVGTAQDYDAANGNFKTFQSTGAGMIVGGAVTAAFGGLLYFLGAREDAAPGHVTAAVGDHAAAVRWGAAF
jgi:hypothetical protein